MSWKIATFVLGAAVLVLLVREFTRTDPAEPRSIGPRPLPQVETQSPVIASQEPAAETSTVLREWTTDAREAALVYFARPTEEARAIPFEERVTRLRAMGGPSIALLEDWIQRSEEIADHGANIWFIHRAYAELLGERAIPLLEKRLEVLPMPALSALLVIESTRAIQIVERFIETLPPGTDAVGPWNLAQPHCSEASRSLLRKWAEFGDPRNPDIRVGARRALFRCGAESERNRIWTEADDRERQVLGAAIKPDGWSKDWIERVDRLNAKLLDSTDWRVLVAALGHIAVHKDRVEPASFERARSILERMKADSSLETARRDWASAWCTRLEREQRERDEENRLRRVLFR